MFFNYPPVQETVEATLREVMRCTRDDIRINTFMLDANSYLTAFVEQLTRMNGGRAFFTANETLGDYVLVDFIEHRRPRAAPPASPAAPRSAAAPVRRRRRGTSSSVPPGNARRVSIATVGPRPSG